MELFTKYLPKFFWYRGVANYPSLWGMVIGWQPWSDELEINGESYHFRLLLSFHFQLSKLSSQFHCVACQFAIRNADFLKNVAQTEVLIVEQLFQAPKPVVMSSQNGKWKLFSWNNLREELKILRTGRKVGWLWRYKKKFASIIYNTSRKQSWKSFYLPKCFQGLWSRTPLFEKRETKKATNTYRKEGLIKKRILVSY